MIEPPKRKHHSGIGFVTVMQNQHRPGFLFTIWHDSVLTEDFIFWLTQLHYYYRNKIIFVWDNPGGHKAAEEFFEERHPDWFEFHSFSTYPPELNLVESCWNEMK